VGKIAARVDTRSFIGAWHWRGVHNNLLSVRVEKKGGKAMVRLSKISSLSIAVGAALCAFQMAQASASEYDRHAKSGQASKIYTFFDCKRHSPEGDGGGTAEHGTVAVKDIIQNRCGNPNEPTREVWYTSSPGFKGIDRVIFPMGHRQTIFNVTVQESVVRMPRAGVSTLCFSSATATTD
jgi:hypothetical protein